MKKFLVLLISILVLLPVTAFSATLGIDYFAIDSISDTKVNSLQMAGMKVRVNFVDDNNDATIDWEEDTWDSGASGTGWSMDFSGLSTGSLALGWKFTSLSPQTASGRAIDSFEINAFANERVFFDMIYKDGTLGTSGSDSGLWGPNFPSNSATQGTSTGGTFFGASYGTDFYWKFSKPVYLTGSVPNTTPEDAPSQHDLFTTLLVDFTDPFTGTFLFAADTDLVGGTEIPEPSTILLFGLGLLGFGAMGRKKA